MSVLYMHIHSFVFTDKKNDATEKMYYQIINNTTGAFKTYQFNGRRGATVKKSVNLKIATCNNQSITVKLFRKGLFKEELISYVDIPVNQLPIDKVTRNNLIFTPVNYNTQPIVLRCHLHLAQSCSPYKCEIVESPLQQVDFSILKYHRMGHSDRSANVSTDSFDEDAMDSPLLAAVVF